MYRTIDAAFWTEQLTGIARRADSVDLRTAALAASRGLRRTRRFL